MCGFLIRTMTDIVLGCGLWVAKLREETGYVLGLVRCMVCQSIYMLQNAMYRLPLICVAAIAARTTVPLRIASGHIAILLKLASWQQKSRVSHLLHCFRHLHLVQLTLPTSKPGLSNLPPRHSQRTQLGRLPVFGTYSWAVSTLKIGIHHGDSVEVDSAYICHT